MNRRNMDCIDTALRHEMIEGDARTWARHFKSSGSARAHCMKQRCPLFAEIWYSDLATTLLYVCTLPLSIRLSELTS